MAAPEKTRKFRWNADNRRAAQLLAEGKLTVAEVARKAKVNPKTLWDWRQEPEFAAYLKEMVAQYATLAERFSIGRVAKRVEVLDQNWRDMQRLKKERGRSDEMQRVAGGRTGLLVHDVKTVGSGEHARQVDIYRFDAALMREMRETAREAAEELGQRTGCTAEKDPSDRPFCKVYLFNPRQLAREGDHEPQRLPPVIASEPPTNGAVPAG
jgi:transposase-like protein